MIWIGVTIYVVVMLMWSIYELHRAEDIPPEQEESDSEEDNLN